MNELALFAGAGGGILAGRKLGWRTACAVELDDYARRVLMARQDDGSLDPFPIWDDVRTFDGRPWAGLVDVISGGFPCQDISVAGRGAGLDGERSGLWSEFARIICEVGPRFVLVENSPALVTRGLGRVLGDLAALGYDAEWGVLGAADVGAPHRRERIWIVAAYAESFGRDEGRLPVRAGEALAVAGLRSQGTDADRLRKLQPQGGECEQRRRSGDVGEDVPEQGCVADADGVHGEGWWAAEPDVGRVAHGVASRVDRLRCLGNGQVPQCAAEAWRQLVERGGWVT